LVVVAVLPSVCFLKVAGDFEHKLITAHGQLGLSSAIDERARRMDLRYQGVELGHYGRKLLATPGDLLAEPEKLLSEPEGETTPLFSYHQVLRTSINSAHFDNSKDFALPSCGLRSPEERQRCVELFLSWSSPTYDQIAADNRYLAETGSSAARSWSSTPFGSEQKLELKARKADNTVREVASLWTPLYIPRDDWRWWLGTIILIAALFILVRWSLRRIFLLDLVVPISQENLVTMSDPGSLIANLSMNLLIIGPASSPTISRLIKRQEVQLLDIRCLLNVEQQGTKTADGISFVPSSTDDPVDKIVRDGRPLVLYNCGATFDDPRANHQSLMMLERVLANLGNRVVITTTVDPTLKAPAAENEQWRALLRSFVRIDLNSSSAQPLDEPSEQFENRISAEAYERWLFSGRTRPQKLVLVHLAQEKLVSPNSRDIVCGLMREGVVERPWGFLTIKDSRFAEFVKREIPPDTIKHWEEQGSQTRSGSLRWSLLVVGAGIAGFLIYTQGEVFNTWVTYATGLAASVPVFVRVFAMFRGKTGAEA
jgi:hypothetical protein